jgi:hypothetical protein
MFTSITSYSFFISGKVNLNNTFLIIDISNSIYLPGKYVS